MTPRMPSPLIQSVARTPRRINAEVNPSRTNDHTAPTNLMPPARRIPLVSRYIIFPSHIPDHYQVSFKSHSPVPREKAFLKPSLPTMPGSLFPRSPSMVPELALQLQTPRIQRVSDTSPATLLGHTNATRTEIHPTMEDYHAEADISSGMSSLLHRCRLF